jgi:alanine-synthesizing transaminase
MRDAKRATGRSIVDLTISNPVAAGFDYPHQQLQDIFGSLADFSYRPEASGDYCARQAVAARYVDLAPEQIALTASTSEAYSVLFKLLCDPGDEVLVPTPSYPLFDYLASLEAVRAIPYRLLYAGGWFVNFNSLTGALSDRTRAIVIVNPNNPTGSFLKRAELDLLLEMADRRGIPLISDEVFAEYPLGEGADIVPTLAGSARGLGFSLSGLSKLTAMPQLKLGWIAVHGEKKLVAGAIERLEHVLDTYLSVSTPVQRVLPQLLIAGLDMREQIRMRIKGNFAALVEELRGSPVQPLHTEGGWSAILQLPRTRSEESWAMELLDRFDVAVQPGYFFDMASEAYAVVSLLSPADDFAKGIGAIKAITQA